MGVARSGFFMIMHKRESRVLAIETHHAGASRPEMPFGYEKREDFLYFGELMEVRVVLILALVTKFHEAIFVDKECILNTRLCAPNRCPPQSGGLKPVDFGACARS